MWNLLHQAKRGPDHVLKILLLFKLFYLTWRAEYLSC